MIERQFSAEKITEPLMLKNNTVQTLVWVWVNEMDDITKWIRNYI